ncbi:hypothetical protein D3C85_1581680 [compost metagenome]
MFITGYANRKVSIFLGHFSTLKAHHTVTHVLVVGQWSQVAWVVVVWVAVDMVNHQRLIERTMSHPIDNAGLLYADLVLGVAVHPCDFNLLP